MDAIDNNMVGGLRYSIIDMSLRGGLGDVTATKSVRLPTPTLTGKVTEKLTAALHSNGRDYWVVVHGWQSNVFYSFLLSPTGISTTPVASIAGPVHQGGGSFFGAANAVGYMRISPNGAKLALAQRDSQFELYDFSNSTGSVSNYMSLQGSNYLRYGIEFSPDNSRLYTTSYSDGGYDTSVDQFNLVAVGASAIQNSRQTIASISGLCVAIQAAPNGKLYLSALNKNYLSSIEQPNLLGNSAGFRTNSVSLGQRVGQNGLPNFPNAVSSVVASTTAQLSAATSLTPNPARAQVTLTLPATMAKQSVEVDFINVLGQIVAHEARPSAASPLTFSLAQLAQGVYTVRISSAAGIASKKLVVE
ncbi:T9SS type A sorting domain-containing protein [Hymenobacter cellulosilyticus]|uniref:T9SS type A sorting domain-containing protein n=1 Tax=Hymenobacter cellulosilyticus TaxID=2932248 RepID=A0A8T9Q3J6_9BACT|nr:T9SS type A sorting domain-containing protein [Hymenobacter cellulosilyticus]UOQ70370.1 T9SS type A sorting domain-containing protein [Hymenobacter cellulosilyticus]